MNTIMKTALAAAGMLAAAQAMAQVTFYAREGFQGESFSTQRQVRDLERVGFNDRASSVIVQNDRWEVCEDVRYSGRCAILRPGRYPTLSAMGLNDSVSSLRMLRANERVEDNRYAPAPAAAQITFYEGEGFQGRSFTTAAEVVNFERFGFNDRASSVVVVGDRFEVCENARFNGRCVVLRPGRYPSLAAMGLNDRVSSVRNVGVNARVEDNRYAPAPVAANDYRRRNEERLYEANVTSVRAVVGPPSQRCWVEKEQVVQERSSNAVPGAIAGALIGGILGHQIGNGRGNDVATVGGAVAGGVVGANIGRNSGGQQSVPQDVQRCASVPAQARADLFDVSYTFRGQEHRVQMTAPPGNTVTVNEQGEPRA